MYEKSLLVDFFEVASFPLILMLILRYLWLTARLGFFDYAVFLHRSSQIFFSLLVVSLIFLVVGPSYRVLADETNLLSIARSIIQDGRAANITEQLIYFGEDHPLTRVDAYRPILFSSLTALVGLVIGIGEFTPFIVNFFVGFATLFVFSCIPWFKNKSSQILSIILFSAFPQFQLNVTSGGFDALFLLMIILLVFHHYRTLYLKDHNSFEAMLVVAVMTAQTRYEACIFLAMPLFAYLSLRANGFSLNIFSLKYLLYIIAASPIFVQKIITTSYANEGDDPHVAFSVKYLFDNLMGSLKFLFVDGFYFILPYAGVVFLIFFFVVATYLFFKGRLEIDKKILFPLAVSVFLIFLSHLLYYMGDYSKPWISRISVIHLIYIVPLVFWAIKRISPNNKLTIFVFISLFFLGMNKSMYENPGSLLTWAREFNVVRTFLSEFDNRGRTLIVSNRSGMYVALGYSSISDLTAQKDQKILLANLRNGLFDRMVILQVLDLNNDPPLFDFYPEFSGLRLNDQRRVQIDGLTYARFSVLVCCK